MPAISKKIKIVIAAASALMTLLFSGFIFLIIVIMVLIGGSEMQVQQYQEDIPSIFSDSVLAYEDTVIRECIGQDIGEYSSVVLAMMQVISNGEGEDPMLATLKKDNIKYSPDDGLKISDPYYSIEVAVKEIAWLINKLNIDSVNDTEKLKILYAAYISDRGVIDVLDTYDTEKFQKYIDDHHLAANGAYSGFPDEVENLLNTVNAGSGGSIGTGSFIWPLPAQYKSLSSKYGYRICPFHGQELHAGIDIPAPAGTPIYASKSGTVTLATYHYSFGNYCIIDHGDGTKTQYNHTSQLLVSVGQTVNQGDVIAKVGSTGSSTGAHLDFRIFINGQSVDPMTQIGKTNTSSSSSGGLDYTAEELDLVARLLCREAGATWASDEHQRLVVSVVVNRVKSPLFPNTIRGVIYQKGQYSPAISETIDTAKPDARTIANAKYVLDHGSICPANVLYQANFKQGSGVYKSIYDRILGTTTYFCYQ